jgi:predicted RecA/RadA family phage recombinase
MKNFIQPGNVIDVAAPSGGVVSGALVIIGSVIGVAQTTEVAGVVVPLVTAGVFELPKASAQAWTVGTKVYWDATNSVATTTASGNTLIGHVVAGAANPSAVGRVKIGPTL